MIAAPAEIRDDLVGLTKRAFVNRCLQLQPETEDLLQLIDEPDRLILATVKLTLRDLALRWKTLDAEVKTLSRQAGDNPERIRNEAAFAKLCGVSPKPASSGQKTGRHRLNRGGDRAANSALYIIAIVRLRHHQPTRAYVERRTAEGLSKREIIRCLKRYIAREVFAALPRPLPPSPSAPLDRT